MYIVGQCYLNYLVNAFFLIVFLAMPNAATASGDSRPFDGTTIRLTMLDRATADTIRPMIPKFTDEIGIRIEMTQFSHFELRKKVIFEHETQSGDIDIFYLSPGWIGLMSKNDWILPLDNYVEEHRLDLSDFPTADLFIKYHEGEDILGLPYISTTHLNIYRTDLFNDAKEKAIFFAKHGYELKPS